MGNKINFGLAALFLCLNSYALIEKDGKFILESIQDFNICQEKSQEGRPCLRALDAWLEENPKNYFEAAKMVRMKMNHEAAVPYFVKGIKVNSKECEDRDLRLSFLAAIKLNREYNSQLVEAALKLGFDLCPKALAEEITDLKEISHAKDNVCSHTKNKNEICR